MNDILHHGFNWDGRNLAGWGVSEKMDGCRGYWDGMRMWSRSGREITLPSWFRRQLPDGFALDGELWPGRGNFARASVAVRLGRIDVGVEYRAFDAPRINGGWGERMSAAAVAIGYQSHVRALEWRRVGSTAEALSLVADVLAQGGEGIMARSPADRCEPGRFSTLLKIKSARQWGA